MPDYRIYEFDELIPNTDILAEAVLILGNGASIAVNNCFIYSKLFEIACSNSILSCNSKELFKELETTDFELILNKLRQALIINNVLNIDNNNVALKTYDNIRHALISAVKEIHIKYNDVIFQIDNIKNFMEQFKTVISLNYDLLVYWAIMASNNATPYKMKDCFTRRVGNDNLTFEYDIKKLRDEYRGVSDPTLVFYPHGSLILASNENNEELKIKLSSENNNLFEEISEKWNKKYVPLFVSEGDSNQKLKAIKRSSYLNFVYENILENLGKTAIIYGWRLAEQEKHLIDKIFHKNGVSEVFISIYTKDMNANSVQDEQDRIIKVIQSKNTNVEVKFFNALSKNCWVNFGQ